MSGGLFGKLLKAQRAAVAPTVGLSLFALIGVGGIAFDYARLASMDSELQNAADQAALAAATQLDGQTDARAHATSAAQSLIANLTRMSNDGGTTAITVPTIIFYVDKPKTTVATTDADANFVLVTVGARQAFYALTPVVAAFSSGNIAASAYAGVGSAICKVPPVMICNPSEPTNNTNPDYDFDANALSGAGLKLITGNATAPGNFGFLETGFGSGAANLSRALGYNTPPGECLPTDGVTTKPGLNASVMDALNTRFDLDTNGSSTCPSGGTCSPSRNVRKDLVKGNNCGTSGNQGWQESPNPYRPTTAAPLTSGYPDIMGHPRDLCHAISNSLSDSIAAGCTSGGGRIGNGQWDRDAYFRVNYGWTSASTWQTNTSLPANATRYQVYEWELAHTATSDKHQVIGSKDGYSYPVCRGTGITPGGTNVDRRRISAAVLNCEALGLNGQESNVPVLKWVDLFLVEPSYQRRRGSTVVTEATDVYAELIGETSSGTAGNTAGQVVRRDVPYLIE
ncbi:pilus assembly protein TadG-related protein [Rhizorhapis sp. SPR117]|uniref:pilus assembly protein TadG-related protein n=1 Tax=Rhizorhapis sp. SPR117 TaxID=2912611 RepID=UPI001F47B66E|nr:pilus assembly protein TadG-related protein [Rhizorhapis sp. SPR117]